MLKVRYYYLNSLEKFTTVFKLKLLTKIMKTKQTYSIMQVLNLAETLNSILTEDTPATVSITVDNDEDIKALAIQEAALWHEPTASMPCYWANVKLGNIEFELEGIKKEFTITFKN